MYKKYACFIISSQSQMVKEPGYGRLDHSSKKKTSTLPDTSSSEYGKLQEQVGSSSSSDDPDPTLL